MKKLTLEFIEKEFKKEGYILLAKTYKDNKQKLDYICPKGHRHTISWNDWSNKGARCWYCFGTPKKSIGEIKRKFENEGYQLLTTTYVGKKQKLNCACKNGHKYKTNWGNWQQGHRCPYCAGLAKPTIEFIKSEFEKENYKLLTTEYINSSQKLLYICPVGHRHSVTWADWHNSGARCFKCKYIKQSGSGNTSWKGGIACAPYCDAWADKEYKESIKKRDGYKCLNPDCYRTTIRPVIHHVDYNKKACAPKNLVTLCTSCNARANKDREWHKDWYQAILSKRYGYKYESSKIVGR